VGPVPQFPREIEDRLDEYLARRAANKISPGPSPEVTPIQSSAGGQRVAAGASP
jgi:hypothetical protein